MVVSSNTSLFPFPSNVLESRVPSGSAEPFQERFNILVVLIIGGGVLFCLLLAIAGAVLLWCRLRLHCPVLPVDASPRAMVRCPFTLWTRLKDIRSNKCPAPPPHKLTT
uniref:Uncharacterized protein n=1 Tax=Eutreptiella gymnastica TaxID=73025 RepID=A0A7S4FN11_9EUGL